ncbi:prefoldin subunit beta [Candidatus Micrarchaeota archaeon CG10_big_fil_rev_8_21_14_0_10_54_18]|nr:MAG: prefoldin subunit beta [Candidatus Micrarchaeota archaeon CG10_big_fil_rev_8_21_14_0_10_54_18]
MAHELSDETRKQLIEFQQNQQQLQMLAYQEQALKAQEMEVKKALEEISKGGEKFYRYAGSIIVPKSGGELDKELKQEKEELELRIKLFGKQVEKLRKKGGELRESLEKALPRQGGDGAQISG